MWRAQAFIKKPVHHFLFTQNRRRTPAKAHFVAFFNPLAMSRGDVSRRLTVRCLPKIDARLLQNSVVPAWSVYPLAIAYEATMSIFSLQYLIRPWLFLNQSGI